jgi:hypothetical protein
MNMKKLVHILLFVLFIGVCAFPLFVNLGSVGARMWDESRNGVNALEMLYNHHFLVTYYNSAPDIVNTKPPLFIWTVAFCMKFFGTTVFALRLPSALSALAIIIYSFFFSKKLVNDWRPGFFAGLILVTSVGFIDFHVARNGDFDAMLSMWIFFYCTQFFLYLKTQEKKHLVFSSLFLVCAIWTKGAAGCFFLPGLLLVTLINTDYRTVLKKKELYVFSLLGLLLGLSYYFIRELYNYGYIEAMIKTELTGRYATVIEGHEGNAFYYINQLNESHFAAWLYWLPVAAFIVFYLGNERIKKLGAFLLIQTVCYLCIISSSQTKLQWYDAPLFPFMALLIGMGLAQLYQEIKESFGSQRQWLQTAFFVLFCVVVYYTPVRGLAQTSIFQEKETYDTGVFYGDFLSNYFGLFPQQKSLTIVYPGYNPHIAFYSKIYRHEGRIIRQIKPHYQINKNDTILFCNKKHWPNYDSTYIFDTLYKEGEDKFVLTMADSAESKNNKALADRRLMVEAGAIYNNLEWFESIKKNAQKKKESLKREIMINALWVLHVENRVNQEMEDYLREKYKLQQ